MSVEGNMFDNDDVTESTGSPLVSKRYVLKLARLERSEHPVFGKGVRWVFHCLDPEAKGDNKIVQAYDGTGNYEYYQTAGTTLQAPKLGQKIPKAYRYACAFLGREIEVGESNAEISRALIGKKAEAFLAPNDNGNLAIMAIDPIGTNYPQFRPATKAPAAPAPEPEAVGATAGESGF